MSEREAGHDPIYLIDELVLRPGRLDDFLAAFHARYVPGATERGQRLLHVLVTPPTAHADLGQSVLILWQLDGLPGFWGMRSTNATPEVAAWWAECAGWVETRTRRFAAAPEAVARFDALGRLHE